MKSYATFITNILITTTLLSGTILASILVSADDVVDEINITVPVSCSLSGVGMNTHNTTINNGQYNSAIGETTIKAFCNDSNGFAIYAIGYTDDTDGNNVLTSSTLGSEHDIVTGTATSGNTSNWAMKLSTITDPAPTYPIIIAGSTADTDKEQGDPDYSSFQEVPDDYALVAKRTSGTDIGQSAEGATLKTTYQAYIGPTQSAGAYTGQVKYILVHPNDVAAPQKPIACNPSGTTIGTNTDTDIICMQDVSSSNRSAILSSMTEDQQYTLVDKRDEKTYTIAKLKDGNIWMTQNLDLDLDSETTYTNEDTDLGWNESTGSYNTASWTPIRSTYNTDDSTWCQGGTWSTQYNSCWRNFTPESYDPGDLYWNGETTTDSQQNQISSTGIPQYHLGNYYNWNAAVAFNDSSDYPARANVIENTNQSICPAGWTLPKSSSVSESLQYLLMQYGWTSNTYTLSGGYKDYEDPLYFTLGGQYLGQGGALNSVGRNGLYWLQGGQDSSGTKYSAVGDFNNVAADEYVVPEQGGGGRYWGLTVRCLTRQ